MASEAEPIRALPHPWAECQHPHPYHSSGTCDYGPGDSIHGPAEECEDQPCINPEAHHDFVP